VGLILGGWLTGSSLDVLGLDIHGWRLTFLINVPIGIVAALLAPRFLPESESHPGQLDIPGAITGTAGLLAIVFGLTHAGNPNYGWSDPWTITSLIAGAVLIALFVAVESRVAHPLLPFRIFANQTRAASFVAMALLPAAMFAMFFFLSLFIQNVMGFSPLKTGVAFLPFSVGIVISAAIVSNLVSRIDARYIAGVGTLISSFALFGFSRLEIPDSGRSVVAAVLSGEHLGADVNYWTQILPFIVLFALGMGAVFVPLTLTAVHHVRPEDSGIGSGVLNTMQQVGGAMGLAILGTVASHATTAHTEEIAPDVAAGLQHADPSLVDQLMNVFGVGSFQELVGQVAYLGSFTQGATAAFTVGVGLMLAGSAVVWAFLDVKHEELATDGPEAAVHVG
jgi:predicted MFS family arabinose efflux permease